MVTDSVWVMEATVDLDTSTGIGAGAGGGTDAGVLAFARAQRRAADAAEVAVLGAAYAWAVRHPAVSVEGASTFAVRGFGDTGVALGGVGCPLVAELCVAEFAAAVGLGQEAGKHLIGQALELRHRLPRLWARVAAGEVTAWRARRIADATMTLDPAAAGFVDTHLYAVAHNSRPWQLDRLVEEAIARFMPAEADRRRREAADGRHFTIATSQVSFEGTSQVHGELDLADALDLDAALAREAANLKAAGSPDTLEVRRAAAAGVLARRQLTLDLTHDLTTPDTADATAADTPADTADATAGDTAADATADTADDTAGRDVRVPTPRQVVLYVHLSEAAVFDDGVEAELARVENTRGLVTADTVRDWCGNPDAQVVVKPVIDLAGHIATHAYEVPDRLAEQVTLREVTCVFPWCTRPARSTPGRHGADCDHIRPYRDGGPTCSCNIAALCRHHHRVKTHCQSSGGRWTYTALEPGTYLWRSPTGLTFLRDHTGTHDLTDTHWPADRPTAGPGRPPDD